MKKLLLALVFPLLIMSCSKKNDPEPDIIIDTPTIDLKYDKGHQFALKKGSEDIFASTFKWTSSDEKVGNIDANGLFEGRKIGKTTITGTSKEGGKVVQSEVTISPYTNFIVEPSVEFSTSMQTIKSKEKRKLAFENEQGILFEDDSPFIRSVAYFFENGKYTYGAVMLQNSSEAAEQTSLFYKERYPDLGPIDNAVGLLDDSRKYGIILTVDATLGFIALYMPFDGGGRVSSIDVKKSIEEIWNLSANRP